MATHPVPTGAPVQPVHLMLMAHRISHAAQDLILRTRWAGQDSPEFRKATRAHSRRLEALYRLARAMERQPGVAGS